MDGTLFTEHVAGASFSLAGNGRFVKEKELVQGSYRAERGLRSGKLTQQQITAAFSWDYLS